MQTLSPALINQSLATLADSAPATFPALTEPENAIVAISVGTAKNPRAGQLTANQMVELTDMILRKVSIRLGYNPRDADEQTEMVKVLALDIQKFPGLTRAEIMAALERGIDGEYSENGRVFFSSSNFVQWIKAYINQTKAPVMKKHAQLLHQVPTEKPVPTIDEQRQTMIELLALHTENRRQSAEYEVYNAAPLYLQLESLGIYQMPLEEKQQMYDYAAKHNPQASPDELRAICQHAAYNNYINQLIENADKI